VQLYLGWRLGFPKLNFAAGFSVATMADSPFALENIGFASAATATHKNIIVNRRKWKLNRLQREAKAAERKAQASKRVLELEACKRARSVRTMRSYFTSSRNSLNRGPLECSATDKGRSGMDGELFQSIDIEILLSCPEMVLVSDDGDANLGDEDDLSADEMVDSDDDAFMDPPSRGLNKWKSTDLALKGAKDTNTSVGMMKKLTKNYD